MRLIRSNKTILFITFSCIFFAFLQFFHESFIYRQDLLQSQPWRLWTAHWVHVGWVHYLLNVLALACLALLFPRFKVTVFISLLLILPPLLSLCFYYFYPNVYAYAGLSGILHGLFIFFAIASLTEASERKFALIILLCIAIKILWEHFFGALQTQQLIGQPVLIQAHLFGVIFGSLCAILCLLFHIKVLNFEQK